MKLFKLIILVAILLPTLAYAGEPVNKTCPISGEDINPDITVNVGYDTIGLCCNGCVKGFKKWDREKRLIVVNSIISIIVLLFLIFTF